MEWEPQRPSAPSTPSSMSSQPTGNSIARAEKIPTLKQISPSHSVSALSKLTDDELRRKGPEDLLRILRRVEGDYKSLLGEHGNIIKDVNRRFQIFVLETRSLKEVNQKLQDDNQELRDLCCFLDDDRQRSRKLAREWQRFGRYTASVMRSEVSVYQEKLRELEDRQSELVNENMELKELCLYMDQERTRMTGDRDEGDGSSNGTVAGHEDGVPVETNGALTPTPNASLQNNYPITPSSAATYIRELELKVHRLEEEKRLFSQSADRNGAVGLDVRSSVIDGAGSGGNTSSLNACNDQSMHGSMLGALGLRKTSVSSKPEAVVHAMKVLQVHEELEKTPTEEDLNDPEKAIVREMCNVVWRKLGDVGDIGSFNESTDSIHDPPFVPDSPGKSNIAITASSGSSLNQGQVHPYVDQPQPQMASTPLSLAGGKTSLGGQYVSNTTDQFPGSAPYNFHPHRQERHHPLRPPQESNPLLSCQPSNPSGHPDSGNKSRQNSLSERLSSEMDKNIPHKQPADKTEEKRNQEYNPSYVSDSNLKTVNQHPPSTRQWQPPPPSHHLPHHLSDNSSQQTDLTSRNALSHYQRQLPPQNPHSTVPRNQSQRSGDQTQSAPQYSQRSETSNFASSGNSHPNIQQQKAPHMHSHQPVKLLDAPGGHSYGSSDSAGPPFQRSAPLQGSERKRNVRGEPSSQAPAKPLRAEGIYEDRNSAERDTQSRPATRSLPSFAVSQGNTQNPQNASVAGAQPNLRASVGFRAYPPKMTSMPPQPVKPSYSSDHQAVQNRAHTVSMWTQEQEWRQTYLDDSDTL